jgi:hypothetical protein
LVELVLFAPLLLFALRPPRLARRSAGFLVALWLAVVSLGWYSNTARDAITGVLLGEDTRYTAGFMEAAFRIITPGRSEREVRDLLGRPFAEFWFYTPADSRPPDERPAPAQQACLIVRFEGGAVAAVQDIAACRERGVGVGLSPVDVDRQLGSPSESCWQYSWSPGGTTYRQRLVCFANDKVQMVVRKWS